MQTHKQVFKVICNIEDMIGYTTASVGESIECTSIINTAEENRVSYCKALTGKTLFNALYGTYTVTLNEVNAMLKVNTLTDQTKAPKLTGLQTTWEDGFK
jgi:hypothetical protein